ncbi:MAG TPA: AbrB/MazE/SpoVT family DNA-binding domain-containing protein [Candidatus Obscuribacterales bacterium]
MLIKQLARCGNSLGVLVPKAVRELLGWADDTKLEYHPEGDTLTLKPAKERQEEALDLLFPGNNGNTEPAA